MAAQDSAELHKLARAMCSVDLTESQWTQVSWPSQLAGLKRDSSDH